MRSSSKAAGLLACLLFPASCQYVVSPAHAPMAMISAYELSNKRKNWLQYAEGGDVYAQFELAESYRKGGLEGEINGKEALRWYCEAGKNGYAKAQVTLGQLYEGALELQNFPVARDNARAWMWYELAKRRVSEDARDALERLEPAMTPQELRDGKYLLQSPKQVPCGAEPLPWVDPKEKT